jgi:DNA primase, catalytic core
VAIPDAFLDELVERSDIVDVVSQYVQLTKKGGNLFGLCPFHNEKTPSFSVSPDKQIYHCFGCGKGGGVVSFIMSIENLSFPDAVRFLAEKNGMTVPEESTDQEIPRQRKRMLELNREAARWFYACLNGPGGAKAAAYLDKRGITRKTANRFGLGAAPEGWDNLLKAMREKGFTQDELLAAGLVTAGQRRKENGTRSVYDKFRDRLMFPVIDIRGEVLGFSGRALNDDQEPKYLNSPETLVFSKRRTLFGMNLAKNTKRGSILLVEGNIDVVTLHQAGFDNAVASMGTALTTEQTRLISRYAKEIVICYDNDPAGKKATERALDLLKNSEFSVRVLKLPDRIVDGKAVKIDADDFIRLRGSDAFEQLLSGSGGGMEFRLGELRDKFDLTDDMQRLEYLRAVCNMLAEIASPVEREVWCSRAAAGCGVTADALKQEVERQRNRNLKNSRKQYERSMARPARNAQPQEKKLRYDDIRSAVAEEGVIRLLLLDPGMIPECSLEAEEFTSPILRRIYEDLQRRQKEGRSVTASALAAGMEEGEAALLTELLNKPESGGKARETLRDYTDVIRREKIMKSGDLQEIAQLMRKKNKLD